MSGDEADDVDAAAGRSAFLIPKNTWNIHRVITHAKNISHVHNFSAAFFVMQQSLHQREMMLCDCRWIVLFKTHGFRYYLRVALENSGFGIQNRRAGGTDDG